MEFSSSIQDADAPADPPHIPQAELPLSRPEGHWSPRRTRWATCWSGHRSGCSAKASRTVVIAGSEISSIKRMSWRRPLV